MGSLGGSQAPGCCYDFRVRLQTGFWNIPPKIELWKPRSEASEKGPLSTGRATGFGSGSFPHVVPAARGSCHTCPPGRLSGRVPVPCGLLVPCLCCVPLPQGHQPVCVSVPRVTSRTLQTVTRLTARVATGDWNCALRSGRCGERGGGRPAFCVCERPADL